MKRLLKTIAVLGLVCVVILNMPGNIPAMSQNVPTLPSMPAPAADVDLHFLKTARATTLEALTMAQGSMFKTFELVHGAILVTHGGDSFLFDTGLGTRIDAQFAADIPAWLKPLLAYEKGVPVVEQLRNNSELPQPNRIFLSHAHWDHASAVVDFPELEIWVTAAEFQYLRTAEPPGVLPSQISSPDILWRQYELTETHYAGFTQSFDIFGDGTAVLVGLAGHTPGAVGLFVNSKDSVRRFFIGDTVWNRDAIRKLRTKFWISSLIVDSDQEATNLLVARLEALLRANPELKIIPAHDGRAWQ
jgi:glyoxylase-like metal-dependent hydrolase (beta-lactamase superfamily II)